MRLYEAMPLSSGSLPVSVELSTSTPGVTICCGLNTGKATLALSPAVTVSVTCTCSPMNISIESMRASTDTCAESGNTVAISNIKATIFFINECLCLHSWQPWRRHD